MKTKSFFLFFVLLGLVVTITLDLKKNSATESGSKQKNASPPQTFSKGNSSKTFEKLDIPTFSEMIFVQEKNADKPNSVREESDIGEDLKKKTSEKEEVKRNYLEGIPVELLKEYEESIKGTTRTFPAFVFVVHLSSVRGPQKMVAFELLEEYHLELKSMEREKGKLSSEEFSLKKNKIYKVYEESFLSLLETKEQKDDFIRFVKKQLKGSKYY